VRRKKVGGGPGIKLKEEERLTSGRGVWRGGGGGPHGSRSLRACRRRKGRGDSVSALLKGYAGQAKKGERGGEPLAGRKKRKGSQGLG
jgi:hypothetical protein